MSAKYAEWIAQEGLEKIKGWAAQGLTVTEIAGNIGVKPKTLYDWRVKFPEFAAAMDAGKMDAVVLVENALFRKCLGYTVEVLKTFKVREAKYDKQGKKISEKERLVQGVDQVHIPADVQAQKFFLTNRAPDDWKNRMEVTPPAASGALEKYLSELANAENGETGDAETREGVNPSAAAPPFDKGGMDKPAALLNSGDIETGDAP